MGTALSTQTIVAVIGAGAMGAGIAQVAAAAGHKVWLLDTRPDAAVQAIGSIRAQFDKLAAKGKLSTAQALAAGERLFVAHQMADLADAGLVIEAIGTTSLAFFTKSASPPPCSMTNAALD